MRAAADDKSKKDFKKWGMNRVAESINSLVAAIEACTRLSTLPDQVDEVVKSREKEREVRIRSGDFNDLRRGVEVFVEGMTAKRNAGSVTVVADEVEAEAEEKVDMYMIGWGDSEEGVKERITSNRALLAGIYSLTDGVEDLLAEHRRCQREAGRTRANKSDSVQAQREKDIWWTSLQGGTVTAEESVDSVPEGLMKESKNADDFENVMEKEVVEKRKETVNVTYESEVRIGVDVGAKKVVPKVQRGWSPGMSVKPIQPESSVPAEEPVIDLEEKKAAKEVEVSETTKESEDINEFFLFIAEDTEATSGDEYIYNSTRGRADNQEWNAESRFVETTVETTERDSDKIVAFLATSLDVTFFLFETIIKSVFPLLMGGGALAADRAVEALSIGLIVSPKVYSRSREIGKDAKEDSMGSWKLLAEFKKQSTVL